MWHWLMYSRDGAVFAALFMIVLFSLIGTAFVWFASPSEADREQERLEQRINQLEEDLEREPKKLL